MEKLESTLTGVRDVLVACNVSEGELILLERAKSPRLYLISMKTFAQVAETRLQLTFAPKSMETHRDWLCMWGEGHDTDHVATVALSYPDTVEVLSPTSTPVQEAKWHPLADDWLAVLFADFYLRLYDMSWKPTPKLAINIAQTLSYDCWPVSFTFTGDTSDPTFYRFACYFLQKDGSIYALNPLIPDNFTVSDSFNLLGNSVSLYKYSGIESNISDWLSSLTCASHKDSMNHYTLHYPADIRANYPVHAIGPLYTSTNTTYARVYCLHPSQPLVLAAVCDNGNIDLLCSFADCVPNFTSLRSDPKLVKFDTIEWKNRHMEAGEIVEMTGNSYLYRTNERIYEIDGRWIGELRRKYETHTLNVLGSGVAPPVLLTEQREVYAVVYLHPRLRESHLLVSTNEGVKLMPASGMTSTSSAPLIDTRSISPAPVPSSSFTPKAPTLLTISHSPGTASVTESTHLPDILAQMTKLVDQMMETRVIPITKRVKFLITLMEELTQRRKSDEDDLGAIEKCVKIQFRELIEGLKEKLGKAGENCENLKRNIEVITQKMNRAYMPLSREEVEIQTKVRRLHTLTEQLKVASRALKTQYFSPSNESDLKRCSLRFPASHQLQEVLALLSRLSTRLEEVDTRYN